MASMTTLTDAEAPEPVSLQEKEAEWLWVEFEANDPENAMHWPSSRKWTVLGLLTMFTFIASIVGTSFAIGSASLEADLGCSHELAILALVTYFAGFGLAPLVLAPLSELMGRSPVYKGSAVLWLIFMVVTAVGKNIETVIIARFLSGSAVSTASTLVGGSIAEMFSPKNRSRPMGLFAFSAFFGTGIGPSIFGYVAQNLGWRWIQYIQIILGGLCALALILFIKETRGSFILKRRAARLRKETNDQRYRTREELEHTSLRAMLSVSFIRPLRFLTTEPIVIFFSLWVGWSWGMMFICLEAIPLVVQEVYSFNVGETGLAFLPLAIGATLGFGTTLIQDRLYRKHVAVKGAEARLYVASVGGLASFAGILIFAFSQGRGHWIGPLIGVTIMITGVYTVYVATFVYLADCYGPYASSALAGQSLCRNIFGVSVPLFAIPMYRGMGFQWASFLAAMLALLLAGTPFLLFKYATRMREKSKFARHI